MWFTVHEAEHLGDGVLGVSPTPELRSRVPAGRKVSDEWSQQQLAFKGQWTGLCYYYLYSLLLKRLL